MNDFPALSLIRRNAYKLCQQEVKSDDSRKLLNQIIGINTVNKQWLDEAKSLYENATRSTGFKKVNFLQNALTSIYACEFAMKNTGIQDNEIIRMKEKIENSYLNTTIEFVETYIHHEKTLLQYFQPLNSAVSLLQECNSKLANQYKIILSRNQSMYQSMQKVQATLELNPLELSEENFKQIRSMIKIHENSLKMTPSLREEILDDLRTKLDQLLLHYQKKIVDEETQALPSFLKIIEYYNEFERYYLPFKDLFDQKRYTDFISKKNNFTSYSDFLNDTYPKLIETYNYYNLPRRQIDKNKIMDAMKTTEKFFIYKDINFLEFNELKPSLHDLYNKFRDILSDEYKEDLVHYLKIENELINAEDNEDKISELVRFIKHLEIKISSEHKHFMHEKFVNLKNEMLNNFDNAIQGFLKKNIPQSNKLETIRISFDFVLNKLYELGDISRIEDVQNQKKLVFKAFNELEQWLCDIKEDFNLFSNLPDSNLKYNLKENIQAKIGLVNEVLPLVSQYNLQNVSDIAYMIDDFTQKLTNPNKNEDNEGHKLIILDNFTMKNIVLFYQKEISIGREINNDISILSDWISGTHCHLDFVSEVLVDNNSTNGSFVNEKPDKIKSSNLKKISTFNLASAFEFSFAVSTNAYSFKLIRITDKELLKDPALKEIIQSLFNTEFICFTDEASLYLNKSYSSITFDKPTKLHDFLVIKATKSGFLTTDPSHDIINSSDYDQINKISDRFSFHLN